MWATGVRNLKLSQLTKKRTQVLTRAIAKSVAVQNKHVIIVAVERAGGRELVQTDGEWQQWWASADVGIVLRVAVDTFVGDRKQILKELQDERVKRLISWR